MASTCHLSIDPELKKVLEREARKRGVSVNALVKIVLFEWWKALKAA